MKQLLSVFPAGLAGIGLLVIRVACAVHLSVLVLPASPPTWLRLVGAIAAVALVLGLLTQVLAILGLFVFVLDALSGDKTWTIAMTMQCLDMLALSLLGAGAYSIDARLFGRRVIKF